MLINSIIKMLSNTSLYFKFIKIILQFRIFEKRDLFLNYFYEYIIYKFNKYINYF